MGMGIFMDKAEAVVMVAIFLGIKVIIINLTIRKTTPITRRMLHLCLLSTRNVAFARLLAQIIRLRA